MSCTYFPHHLSAREYFTDKPVSGVEFSVASSLYPTDYLLNPAGDDQRGWTHPGATPKKQETIGD